MRMVSVGVADVNTGAYGFRMKETKQRLGRQEWINAGFRALTDRGPEGLRVEPIARELGATKGSFYWHFKDLPDLQMSMLAYWELAATHRIIARLEALPRGWPRLDALMHAVNLPHDDQGGAGAEAALRAWGRTFAPAGEAVARVDAQRLAFLRDCLTDCGVAMQELPALFYAAHLGLEQLSMQTDVDPVKTLTRLVTILRDLQDPGHRTGGDEPLSPT